MMGTTYMAINSTKREYFDCADKRTGVIFGDTARLLVYLTFPDWEDEYCGRWHRDDVEIISEHDPRIDEHELYSMVPDEEWGGPIHGWTNISEGLESAFNAEFPSHPVRVHSWRLED